LLVSRYSMLPLLAHSHQYSFIIIHSCKPESMIELFLIILI